MLVSPASSGYETVLVKMVLLVKSRCQAMAELSRYLATLWSCVAFQRAMAECRSSVVPGAAVNSGDEDADHAFGEVGTHHLLRGG